MKTITHPLTRKPIELRGSRYSSARVEGAIRLASELRIAGVPPEQIQATVSAYMEELPNEQLGTLKHTPRKNI